MNSQIIDKVLVFEGSEFTNDPSDNAGATRWGVTQSTLEAWRNRPVSVEEVRNLSLTEAREILTDLYIKKPGFDRIGSDILRESLVDYAVHSGPSQAIKSLQRCLGLKVDGILGPETETASNLKTGPFLALKLNCQRLRLLGKIVSNDPTQAKFAAGWANRIAEKIESLA